MSKKHPLSTAAQLDEKAKGIMKSYITTLNDEIRQAEEHIKRLEIENNAVGENHLSLESFKK